MESIGGGELSDKDRVLVKNVLNGDIDSFSALIGSYQEPLFNFVFRLTSCRQDAEEILQDVFIRVFNYLYRYNEQWDFSTWIFRIAVNSFKDHYKKKKRHMGVCSIEIVPEEIYVSNSSPDAAYERKEDYMNIVRIINNLKKDQRMALILKYIHGFSYLEIGKILGISTGNAKLKVFRARQIIGKEFEGMSAEVDK